jgi:hypothetical protein
MDTQMPPPPSEAAAPTVVTLCRQGRSAIAVGLDRRAACRFGARTAQATSVPSHGVLAELVAHLALGDVLQAYGITIETREQGAPGLHWRGPLYLAAWSAARQIRSGGTARPDTETVAAAAARWPIGALERDTALAAYAGGVAILESGRVTTVAVDPGWLEERISIFDLADARLAAEAPASAQGGDAADPGAWGRALQARDHDAVAAAVEADAESATLRRHAPGAAIAALARELGAVIALRAHAAGATLAAWHPPGQGKDEPAAQLAVRLKALGARTVLARLDLLGLEVE